MTNEERWKFWNRDSFSPEIFIEWSWWMLITSALQRRVWYDNDTYPLYPNAYIILVAPPGVGKGLQLDQIKDFLEYHKVAGLNDQEVALAQHMGKRKSNLLFPLASDSTTFESFLEETHMATRVFDNQGTPYVHASQTFILDEFESIFKKNAEDMAVYLRTAWNCKDYTRKTKNSGVFLLKNPCVSILGGVTPDAMMAMARKEIISNGFTSRAILVYARKNRREDIKLPKPTPEQLVVRDEIRTWIKHLSTVYGCCTYSPEADEVLRAHLLDKSQFIVNTSNRLEEYYARKITNMNKIIMAMHFSEPGHEKPVGPETIQRAIALFSRTEINMHCALSGGGRNELGDVAKKLADYIVSRPDGIKFQSILIHFFDHGTKDELEQVLQVLQAQGTVVLDHNSGLYKPTRI